MTSEPPSLLLGCIMGLLVAFTVFAFAVPLESTKPEPYHGNRIIIQGNSIASNNYLFYAPPLNYKSLIGCLEWHESRGDEKAVGKAGEIGCLQFMPSTFQMYCIDKYHIAYDMEQIWDCETQKECADKMISSNWNNLYHWTTAKFCID